MNIGATITMVKVNNRGKKVKVVKLLKATEMVSGRDRVDVHFCLNIYLSTTFSCILNHILFDINPTQNSISKYMY